MIVVSAEVLLYFGVQAVDTAVELGEDSISAILSRYESHKKKNKNAKSEERA